MRLDDKQCIFVRENGLRCNSLKAKDSDYCFWHDPDISEDERKQKVKKNKKKITREICLEDLTSLEITTIEQLPTIINKLIQDVYVGRIDTKVSNALSNLIKNYKDIAETVLLVKKIESLENTLNKGQSKEILYEYSKED